VVSPYYSESELCGGAVTVSFSKYPPLQAMHFLQRSAHFSKTCCRQFAANFRRVVEQELLTSEPSFHGWKSLEIAWGEIWTLWLHGWVVEFLIHFVQAEHRIQSRNADAPIMLFRHPKKGYFKTTVTPFSRSGWSVVRSAHFPKEVLRKRDRHRSSIKFRLGLIMWVRELCKRPSCIYKYIYIYIVTYNL
jgi:hypothetical protein